MSSDLVEPSDADWAKVSDSVLAYVQGIEVLAYERDSEITALRARLELTGEFADGPDGIECRDDTIKLQDARIEALEAELAATKAKLAELCDWVENEVGVDLPFPLGETTCG